jgi:hypothetical protein
MIRYKKKETQPMFPWNAKVDMTGVSVSIPDKEAGSPKMGDMIAVSEDCPEDKWLVSKEFFEKNYEEAVESPKTFLERLEKEKVDLFDKIGKLNMFLDKAGSKEVSITSFQSAMLHVQLNTMMTYYEILVWRLNDIKRTNLRTDPA